MRRTLLILFSSMSLLAVSAADASALELRFLHAAAGAGPLTLSAGTRPVDGPVSFGRATEYVSVPGGSVALSAASEDGRVLAKGREALRRARHTVIATRSDGRVRLRTYRDGRAAGGVARVRVIQAAPELGTIELALDGRRLGRDLAPGDATRYSAVEPGTYDLRATRPGGGGGDLASRPRVSLTAGTASTAFVVGSGGEPTSIVVANDASVAPTRPPATGLGGLSGGAPWALAAAAALAAGALGLGLFRLRPGRPRGG